MEVVFGIEGQFRCAVIGFDEDGLEGVLQHRVFIGDEEYRPVFGYDALKFVTGAEGTFVTFIDNGHRFGAADLGVKNEMGLPCGHG